MIVADTADRADYVLDDGGPPWMTFIIRLIPQFPAYAEQPPAQRCSPLRIVDLVNSEWSTFYDSRVIFMPASILTVTTVYETPASHIKWNLFETCC